MSTLPQVLAHQSGDGVTIAHCPFCGSGQVLGRSDGNTECMFCNQSFMVRVQPMYSAFPQTIDGMPVDIPGMPPGAPAGMPPGGMPPGGDPGAAGAPPGAPGEDGSGAPPFGGDSDSSDSGSDDGPPDSGGSDDDSGGGGNPFGKKSSYRTGAGQPLARTAYVDYLASRLEGHR
ncbi:hypothetical protein ACH4S8_37805 [Streptomyces sp. NPDC021080]|uniref:hypothetical protein n=1 Tax=Streptomyces sp. NPDC021080 TaxID=3365110 RepID=UPI0037B93AB8